MIIFIFLHQKLDKFNKSVQSTNTRVVPKSFSSPSAFRTLDETRTFAHGKGKWKQSESRPAVYEHGDRRLSFKFGLWPVQLQLFNQSINQSMSNCIMTENNYFGTALVEYWNLKKMDISVISSQFFILEQDWDFWAIGSIILKRASSLSFSLGTFGILQNGILSTEVADTGEIVPQPVRIKSIRNPAELSSETPIRVMFEDALLLNGIGHENVNWLVGCVWEANAPPMLVYNGAQHQNLRKRLESSHLKHFIQQVHLVELGRQALSGLQCIHGHGVVHKDIAARNCL